MAGLFLITGATGKTGRGAVDLLLAGGHRVRALAHNEDERSRALAEAGAEVVFGDLHDLDSVTAAMQGVSGAYFCYPDPARPGRGDRHFRAGGDRGRRPLGGQHVADLRPPRGPEQRGTAALAG